MRVHVLEEPHTELHDLVQIASNRSGLHILCSAWRLPDPVPDDNKAFPNEIFTGLSEALFMPFVSPLTYKSSFSAVPDGFLRDVIIEALKCYVEYKMNVTF